jgi:radial spoke head protein 4/6
MVIFFVVLAGGPWKRLPDVIPERLQAARRIRKYFTGRLDAPVILFSRFNGMNVFLNMFSKGYQLSRF